jgi:hypothetical protein
MEQNEIALLLDILHLNLSRLGTKVIRMQDIFVEVELEHWRQIGKIVRNTFATFHRLTLINVGECAHIGTLGGENSRRSRKQTNEPEARF